MIIIDRKDMYLTPVDKLTHYRRFEVPKGRQLKRVVEFSHSIDSLRHPLIQLSDLVIYTTRKFLEYDNGYRPSWSTEAKNFFASCYDRVQTRMWRTNLIDVEGKEEQEAHANTQEQRPHCFALTSFQPTPPTPGANSSRLAPSTFNPSLEDCPGALNSRLP